MEINKFRSKFSQLIFRKDNEENIKYNFIKKKKII